MRDIHLDLLSNEWGQCREEMFNIWSVEFDMYLSKERHYISTVIILYKQNVLCARMMGWGGGGIEEKELGPWRSASLWHPSVTPLIPEKTNNNSITSLR